MARSRSASSRVHRHSRVPRVVLGIVYLAALSGLILWEYHDRLDLGSGCDAADAEARPAFFTYPYRWFLEWSHGDSATQVSVVAIPNDLENIQRNVCLGRGYLADVLRAVAFQHPAEIVLDKYFGASACSEDAQSTEDLRNVVQSLQVPVVVGESTDLAETERSGSCLVRKPQLDFRSPNVHHGLTRLNAQNEKVPLAWRVRDAESGDSAAKVYDIGSLAWTAVTAYDPNYTQRERIRSLKDINRHPYANLEVELPRETSSDLLCDTGTVDMRHRWGLSCSDAARRVSMLGRVVVIGSEQDVDRRFALGQRMWGMDLQARYIQALLSGNYLRATPSWLDFLLFCTFIFVIEGLPTILEAFRPHWKKHRLFSKAFQRRRYVWVGFWTVATIVITSAVALVFGFLPPLILFGDIVLVAVTRLLFFAAESTEVPFLHQSTKGAS